MWDHAPSVPRASCDWRHGSCACRLRSQGWVDAANQSESTAQFNDSDAETDYPAQTHRTDHNRNLFTTID